MELEGPPRSLTQEEYDTFLFMQLAKPGTVDLAKSRDERVVDQMLRLREQGDHPSVISATSRLMPVNAAVKIPPRRLDTVMEEWNPQSEDVPKVDPDDSASNVMPFVGNFKRAVQSFETPQRHASPVRIDDDYRSRASTKSKASSKKSYKSGGGDDGKRRESNKEPPSPTMPSIHRHFGGKSAFAKQLIDDDSDSDFNMRRRADRRFASSSDKASNISGMGFGQDILKRTTQEPTTTMTPFQRMMEKNLEALQAPPPALPHLRSSTSDISRKRSVSPRDEKAYFGTTRTRRPSRDSAIESSVSHPNRAAEYTSSKTKQYNTRAYDDRSKRSSRSRHSRYSRRSKHSRRSRYSRYSRRSRRSDYSRRSRNSRRSGRSGRSNRRRNEEARQARHEIILKLDMYKVKFDNEAPTYELETMLERVVANNQVMARVAFMKMGIKLGALGIELLADKFAPKLRLSGWSESLSLDLDTGNYDYTLEQLYRKFFRRGPPNAYWSLGLLILGSAFFHCMGGAGARNAKEGGAMTGMQKMFSKVSGIVNSLGGMGSMFGMFTGGNGAATASSSKDAAASSASTSHNPVPKPSNSASQTQQRRSRIAAAL